MKIQYLRFKNLNALLGEWEIDFTHPAYASDGIFAITGPTGSGKTTLLDAICLALYGRTPRLDRISKSTNEIMSRQAGECFAEVSFETRLGRYRCHFGQHRAHKKPDGELQNPRHEIVNADTEAILSSSIRGVAEEVERLTGLNFDRFTRSILLAQGGFAAFLQASPDERSPILEQLTGSRVYSDISIFVHERRRLEHERHQLLQAQTDGIKPLSTEEEAALEHESQQTQAHVNALKKQGEALQQALNWHANLKALKEEIDALQTEARQSEQAIEQFQAKKQALKLAETAATLEGDYVALQALRERQTHDRQALKALDKQKAALDETQKTAHQQWQTAEQHLAQLHKEFNQQAQTWQEVRLLDGRRANIQQNLTREQASLQQLCRELKTNRDQHAELLKQQKQLQTKQETAQTYLNQKAGDEWLVAGLAGLKEKLQTLSQRVDELSSLQKEMQAYNEHEQQLIKQLSDDEKQLQNSQKALLKLEESRQRLQGKKDELLAGQLLREYRQQRDGLLRERALLLQIMQLEEQRLHLEAGKPCPLCGSTTHPYVIESAPRVDETDKKITELDQKITQIEAVDEQLEQLERQRLERHAQFVAEQRQVDLTQHNREQAEHSKNQVKNRQLIVEQAIRAAQEVLVKQLQPFGITLEQLRNAANVLQQLEKRLSTWQNTVQRLQHHEGEATEVAHKLARLDATLTEQSGFKTQLLKQADELTQQLQQASGQRQQLFGQQDVDAVEKAAQEALRQAREQVKLTTQRHDQARLELQDVKARQQALQESLSLTEPAVKKSEEQFIAKLKSVGFATEAAFLVARLPLEQRQHLRKQWDSLQEQKLAITSRANDRQTRLDAEQAKALSDKSQAELQQSWELLKDQLDQAQRRLLAQQQALHENTLSKKRHQDSIAALQAQAAECQRWDNLHELIGSSDGKKYRNFAQGLTFEAVVSHANHQLQAMSDRYLLLRDPLQPLELNVIDNYQAGEVRSTKNLSGGESFLVSLALALGLSQMASRNVQIDSLFLDEGFGTLDDEALDTALDTLAGLQQDGKLIGVISHVPALKERISSQIQLQTQAGRSRLLGPGCRRLSAV